MDDVVHSPAKPLVAIVTPVYNGAAFIEGAIQSVLAQTYRPIVHVILDNACKDETPEIIARYIAQGANIVTARNPETVPQIGNFNAAARLIPAEASYFRLLCADDRMPPDAIEQQMAVAMSARNVVMVGGIERRNGVTQQHYFPRDASIYEASNVLSRWLMDFARLPVLHVLCRTDALKPGERFYDPELVSSDTELALRILSRGGRFGFVHAPIGDTTDHPDDMRSNVDFKLWPALWEHLYYTEIYGPGALSNTAYARLRRYHLNVLYRRMMWWRVTGRSKLYKRDITRLRERRLAPSLADYVRSVFAWPMHLYAKRIERLNRPRPWPADAVRPGADERARSPEYLEQ